MWIDYDVQRTTRRCSATERAFEPGEEFYSVLAPSEDNPHGDEIHRFDLCRDAWQGPPAGAIGWWRARLPDVNSGKAKLAPNEVLLELFDRWGDDPAQAEARYVLALLLVRRRVLKLQAAEEAPTSDQTAGSQLSVYCPSRDAAYEVPVAAPDAERAKAIQSQLFELLYAEGK